MSAEFDIPEIERISSGTSISLTLTIAIHPDDVAYGNVLSSVSSVFYPYPPTVFVREIEKRESR